LIYGLAPEILADLRRTFARHAEVERVLIFGSRAKGHFKDGSDIDLAVFAPTMSEEAFTRLWQEVNGLPMIFKVDLLHWDTLGDERIKSSILASGKPLLPAPPACGD